MSWTSPCPMLSDNRDPGSKLRHAALRGSCLKPPASLIIQSSPILLLTLCPDRAPREQPAAPSPAFASQKAWQDAWQRPRSPDLRPSEARRWCTTDPDGAGQSHILAIEQAPRQQQPVPPALPAQWRTRTSSPRSRPAQEKAPDALAPQGRDPSLEFVGFSSPPVFSFASGPSAPNQEIQRPGELTRQESRAIGARCVAAFPPLGVAAAWAPGSPLQAPALLQWYRRVEGQLRRDETVVGEAKQQRRGLHVARPSARPERASAPFQLTRSGGVEAGPVHWREHGSCGRLRSCTGVARTGETQGSEGRLAIR